MVVMSGESLPVYTTGENSRQVAADTLKIKLRCQVKCEDMVAAHRIGKKPDSQAADRRSILIRLRDRGLKNDLLHTARKSKPAGLFLNDNLTPSRSTILFALRKAKKLCPEKVIACGSSEGKVFVWLRSAKPGEGNTKIFVNNENKLEKLFSGTFGIELGTVINNNSQ